MAQPYSNPVSIDVVRAALEYNPETGDFKFKARRPGKVPAGTGTLLRTGYRVVRFGQQKYLLHRLAWAIHYGRWPTGEIDHINGDKSDNRIANLREATRQQNCTNRRAYGKSGYKGVVELNGRWMAQITIDGSRRGLGVYETPEAAHAAYVAVASKAYGEFFRAA